jgi:hypothetical protein
MAYAKGKYSQSISDRSGQAFPYREMVKEWNGSWVHISEFEAKHPQLDPKPHMADPIALWNARPQRAAPVTVYLDPQYWDGQWTSNGMQPSTPSLQENNRRQLGARVGSVTIAFPVQSAPTTGANSTTNVGSVTIVI